MSSIHADPPPPIVTEPSGINYATGAALGKGGFAICHRAERYDGSRPTGQIVALKIVKTKMEPAKLAQKFVTELQIHSKLSHPNIVTFYRAFSFQTSTYVVLELCSNGSLADMLKRRRHLTLPEIRRLVIQVCGAVKYLHHRHIVHRDLKTGNLFLDERMNVRVGDFGLAALLVTEKEMEVRRRTTMCGTPNYLAPEILEKGKGHDEKVDIWAIGVIAYTLAVGKAPFHASTKEEIYKKLRSGTYAWPELSATTNQSADLRDLVSSLLVPEEQRPVPDKVVSHSFFRMAFVPPSIPESAKEKAPYWSETAVPSADVVKQGYSDTWYRLCAESGVGEDRNGKAFPLNGGQKIRSVVYDMQKEAMAGRQPTMPIPKDIVYTSTVSDFDALTEPTQPKPAASRTLKEINHNEVAYERVSVAAPQVAGIKDAELMPPPRAPSRAARSGTVRRAARTISEEAAAKSAEGVKVATDPSSGTAAPLKVSKTRLAHAASTSALKQLHNSSSSTAYQTAATHQETETKPEKLERTGSTRRQADASLARRPRGNTTRERPKSPAAPPKERTVTTSRTMRERPLSTADAIGAVATLDELKQKSPFRFRRKAAAAEVVEVLSDPESEVKTARADIETRHLRTLAQAPQPPIRRTASTAQRRVSPQNDLSVPDTDPSSVLQKLSVFRDNLAQAISKSTSASTASTLKHRSSTEAATQNLPFVSRWVDYSRKHGVGYVLSDGTVGCIINASSSKKPNQTSTPVTHVLVRNGQRWLNKIGQNSDFDGIEHIPLEVLEDCGEVGVQRKVYKGLGSVKEGPLLAEAERRRTLSILWVKFGRYMCQSLDGGAPPSRTSDDDLDNVLTGVLDNRQAPCDNFVRLYQRIGSVGVWVFADGCMQIHFPDHTKLVLSSCGRLLSATVLSVDAATHLTQTNQLLPHHVASRQVLADDIRTLLSPADSPFSSTSTSTSSSRARTRIVKANHLALKLAFVHNLVGQWLRNGGLGRVDGDDAVSDAASKQTSSQRLVWSGLAVKSDQAPKKGLEYVTVGRFGGDSVQV